MPVTILELMSRKHIIWAMKRPHNPEDCLPFLLGCFTTAFPHPTLSAKSELKGKEHPADLMMAFVTAPRSAKQLEKLESSLVCRCSPQGTPDMSPEQREFTRKMHRMGIPLGKNVLTLIRMLIEALDRTLAEAIEIGGDSFHKERKRHRKYRGYCRRSGHKDLWPERSLQLFPHGPEDTVRSLLQWLKKGENLQILATPIRSFLSRLVRAGRQAVIPYVVTAPISFDMILRDMVNYCSHWHKARDSGVDSPVKRAHSVMKHLRSLEDLLGPLSM